MPNRSDIKSVCCQCIAYGPSSVLHNDCPVHDASDTDRREMFLRGKKECGYMRVAVEADDEKMMA